MSGKANRKADTKVVNLDDARAAKGDYLWVKKHRPAWAAYLQKHGFEVTSFNRGSITEIGENGYPNTLAWATLRRDGTVNYSSDEHAPTAVEAAAIVGENESAKGKMPRSVLITLLAAREQARKLEADANRGETRKAFILEDIDGQRARMIHLRIEKPDGKDYIPVTYWSDGHWRWKEPNFDDYPDEAPNPLYNLPGLRLRNGKRVENRRPRMIHEGAKAAYEVIEMLADDERRAAHPLGEELAKYDHHAVIGGTNAYDRTNYEPLKKAAAEGHKIVFAADNDTYGEEAVYHVSELLSLPMDMVRFDDRFPPGFDFGDDWPTNKEWWKDIDGASVYVGPTLRDLMRPATWATDRVKVSGKKGAPSFRLRKHFAREWVKSTLPDVFVNVNNPRVQLTPTEFNSYVDHLSHAKDTGAKLSKYGPSKVDRIEYLPDKKRGKIGKGPQTVYNVYEGTDVVPAKGDVVPFLDFMEKLIPNEKERNHLLRWMATLIARPDVRMHHAVLLISEMQGVGKSTLGEAILAPLVGMHNTSFPSEVALTESQYNTWLAFKRLIVVHEIYAGKSRKAYNKLKNEITEKNVDVSKKYQSDYTIENHSHFFACSNSKKALALVKNDRRWFVPRVTEKKEPVDYYIGFHSWLEGGGLRIILHWAKEYVKKPENVVRKGDPAPDTQTKHEVVEENMKPDYRLLGDFAEFVIELKKEAKAKEGAKDEDWKVVLSIREVHEWVARKLGISPFDSGKLAGEAEMRKLLMASGFRGEETPGGGRTPRYMFDSAPLSAVVMNFEVTEDDYKRVVELVAERSGESAAKFTMGKYLRHYLRKPSDLWPTAM